MGGRSGSGFGEPGDGDGLLDHRADGIGVEPVGGGARRAAVDRRAHREVRAPLGHILMDGVVGEAGQRLLFRIDNRFDIGHARGARGGGHLLEDFVAALNPHRRSRP